MLDKNETQEYLKNGKESAKETAREIAKILSSSGTENDAFEYFKDKFYHGYVKEIYPIDAMTLNTNIMIGLIKKNCCRSAMFCLKQC